MVKSDKKISHGCVVRSGPVKWNGGHVHLVISLEADLFNGSALRAEIIVT